MFLRRPVFASCAVFCALALCAAPSRAQSEDEAAFQKIIGEHNKEHLDSAVPIIGSPTTSMIDSTSGYSREEAKGPWELRDGDISIHVELKRTESIDVSAFPKPVLTLTVGGKKVLVSEGSPGQPDLATFVVQIAELDPDNAHPEVVFSSYTGGAHCCSDTRVLVGDRKGGSWKEIEVGLFDGGLLLANDLDGDGRYEFATRDNNFLYAFGCYACSSAPLKVFHIDRGKVVDVSARKRYREAHQTHLARMVKYVGGPGEGSNGFFAGYVAQKIRLGEGSQAWNLMLEFHDRKDDWGLDYCAVKRNEKDECPPGKTVKLDFPGALKRFLKLNGYPVPPEAN